MHEGSTVYECYGLLLLGRLFDRVDLIKPVSNVRPSVHAYVCPFVHKNVFLISMKFGI